MRQIAIFCILQLHFAIAFCQAYQPLAADTALARQAVEAKRQLWLSRLPANSNEWLKEAYEGRYNYLQYAVQNQHFLYGSALQPFLDSVVAEICRANPDIPADDIVVLPSRYAEPNAASLGDGAILINLGLLRRLENESQLAFVLCHEIAHYTLQHLEASVEQYGAVVDDKGLQKKIKRLGKAGANTEALGLLGKVIYDNRRQNREQEAQADARGLAYFANTSYDVRQAIRCLELLDSIDREKYPEPLDLKAALATRGYPFKSRWLEEEASMFGGSMGESEEEVFHPDSLRTHPACQERIQLLNVSAEMKQPAGGNVYLQDSLNFRQWVRAADYELVEGLYAFGATAAALYQCLKLLRLYPEDPYLNTMVGLCLLQVRSAMENHDMEEHVPLPGHSLQPDFRQLCLLLHNLRIRELAALSYHFLKEREAQFSSYERFLSALRESQKHYGK